MAAAEGRGAATGTGGRGAGTEGGDWRGGRVGVEVREGAREGRARGVEGRGGGTRGGAAAGARRGGWRGLPDATGACGAGLVCLLLVALRSLLPSALLPVLGVGPKSISWTSTFIPPLTSWTVPKSSTSASLPRAPPSLSELSPAPMSFPTACIARFDAILRRWTGGTEGTRISSSEDSSSDARAAAVAGKAKKGAGAVIAGGGMYGRGERS